MIDRDGAVFAEPCNKDSDAEKQLIVADEKDNSFDDWSPEILAPFSNVQHRDPLECSRYESVKNIFIVSTEDAKTVTQKSNAQVC